MATQINNADAPSWSAIFNLINQQRLVEAIGAVRKLALDFPMLNTSEVNHIDEDYRLMLHYVGMGFNDPERDNMYSLFIHRLYRAVANMRVGYRRQKVGAFTEMAQKTAGRLFTHDVIRRELEDFVASKAMMGLEEMPLLTTPKGEIFKQHQAFMSALFCRLMVSPQWNEADTQFYSALLLSPTIDTVDALLLVSAISFSTWQEYDDGKFQALVDVYEHASDSALRQRALVGWAFATPYIPTLFSATYAKVARLCAQEQVVKELTDMQKQVIFCVDAEKDHNTIQREIMPTLLQNNNLNITRNGMITEKEDDPMEDILDPDAADRRMEEMENTIHKMIDMQQAGSDIYFGGFAQLKRSAFFHDLSNWFCPFYPEHPAIEQAMSKVGNTRILLALSAHTPLCDSDKYSFVQAISTVIDKMPQSIREMITSGAAEDQGFDIPGMDKPEYIRRFYLQDLYRFFRLYHYKQQVRSPFSTRRFLFMTAPVFAQIQSDFSPLDICDTLRKRSNVEGFRQMAAFCEEHIDSADSLLVQGIYAYDYEHNFPKAQQCLQQLLQREPEHEKATLYLGRTCFETADYPLAEKCFKQLSEKRPDRKSYALNYCIALTKTAHFDEALPMLYKLNYQYPDDENVLRVLAWTLMGLNRLEQAEQEYAKLADREAGDALNHGYCRLVQGDVSGAVNLFRAFIDRTEGKHSLYEEFRRDAPLFEKFNISPTDQALMIDLVASK